LPVGAHSADIGHEDPRLAGDVRAHVEGVGRGIKGGIGSLFDVKVTDSFPMSCMNADLVTKEKV
jgi:hypothetical protein